MDYSLKVQGVNCMFWNLRDQNESNTKCLGAKMYFSPKILYCKSTPPFWLIWCWPILFSSLLNESCSNGHLILRWKGLVISNDGWTGKLSWLLLHNFQFRIDLVFKQLYVQLYLHFLICFVLEMSNMCTPYIVFYFYFKWNTNPEICSLRNEAKLNILFIIYLLVSYICTQWVLNPWPLPPLKTYKGKRCQLS